MMEIRLIRKQLQTRKDELLSVNFALAEKRLADFLNYINNNQLISNIISKLPNYTNDWDKWESSLWNSMDYEIPEDEALATKMCFDVLVRYKGKVQDISLNFNHSSRNITDHIQAYFETFVPFLYEYLDNELQEMETIVSPIDMIKESQELVDDKTSENFPDINLRLMELYKKLFTAETSDDFVGIANSCRTIIIDFASQTYRAEYKPKEQEEPKGDDAKHKLTYTYKFLHNGYSKTYIEGKNHIINGIWKVISSLVHRKKIQKREIKECVLLTYLLINTFIEE